MKRGPDRDVLINGPFSPDYHPHFQALVFAVIRSGFTPRCARERDDAGEVRSDKICRIIAKSRYGIHDISETEPDPGSGLPRFNMPLELGLYLGARRWGRVVDLFDDIADVDRYRGSLAVHDRLSVCP